MLLRIFGVSIGITILGLVLAGFYGGWEALGIVAILIVLEVSISFDNAVVNATVLQRMSVPWQRIFLTVGVLIAVFGMRLVFPLLIVSAVAQLTPWDAFMLALQRGDAHDPGTYGYILHEAHPAIAAFGGIFLLMLFLDFVFGERELRWLRWFEVPLARVGRLDAAAAIVALAVLVLASTFLADPEDRYTVLLAGVLGLGSYLLVNALSRVFHVEVDDEAAAHAGEVKKVVGKAAFFLFLYLEVLDASFSFDGVIGAFAITSDPVLILVGLGVGAFYIRSITIYLVRKGTLGEFRYLEHGAMWAVGALAVILLLSIRLTIPEIVTGLVGVAFIGAGFISSIVANRRERALAR